MRQRSPVPRPLDRLERPLRRKLVLATLLALASFRLGAATQAADSGSEETALDRYVRKPDASYRWDLAKTIEGDGYTAYVLDLVSQSWRAPEEVDRTEWRHWLTVIVPTRVRSDTDTALLWIGGGRNGDVAPEQANERSLRLALASGTVVADLGMVPNQPLHMADSPRQPRSEDDLIAYGRVKYLVTGDEEWLVRLPMVKSGARAMDAIQELLSSGRAGEKIGVERFVVAGGSKRGWTTWLVGAVDPRVRAIVPLVIDALNTEAVTRHHFEAYGFFSTALGDYVRHGLYPHLFGTPGLERILEIEDPYLYRHRERLRIPKYVINASGDQYFLPDNSRFYFHDMPDVKHLRYVPNAKHDLEGSDARDGVLAWYRAILADRELPRFDWTIAKDGAIEVRLEADSTAAPHEVLLWQASNPDARDFRLDTIGRAWTSEPLQPASAGVYRAALAAPERGWRAFFVELVYDGSSDAGALGTATEPLRFTTDVSVLPDALPYRLEDHRGPWLEKRRP